MAFFKGSYYEDVGGFDPPGDGSRGFRGVRARPITAPEPVLEHTVSEGERLDGLGQSYYAQPRDWRRLADCNPDTLFPEDLVWRDAPAPGDERIAAQDTGRVLLVPRRREGAR